MLAISSGSDPASADASSGVFSAPAATARAAVSGGVDAPSKSEVFSDGVLESPDSRICRQLAHAAAVVSAASESLFAISLLPSPTAGSATAPVISEEAWSEETWLEEVCSEGTSLTNVDAATSGLSAVAWNASPVLSAAAAKDSSFFGSSFFQS